MICQNSKPEHRMYQVTDVEKLTMCHSAQVLSDSHTKRRIDERTNRRPQDSTPQLHTMHTAVIYTINVPDAVTLGGAYNGGAVYPVGVLGHVSCCSGRWVFSSSSGCVGYLC